MEDNVVLENIKSRRSIRKFQEKAVPKDLVERIVEAGTFAPSALNRQPWKFIIVDDRAFIEELSKIATARIKKLYRFAPFLRLFIRDLRDERVVNAIKKTVETPRDAIFYRAPLVIFAANDGRFAQTAGECYLAAQNMMLAARSLGIGSCFIGRAKAIPKKILLNRFNLPGFYDFNVCLALGYPEDFPKTPPARREDAVKWI